MSKSINKWFQVLVIASLVFSPISWANENTQVETERPSYGAVIGDVIFARPLGLAATFLGGVVFIVTSPLTAVTGTIGEAGQTLVVEPAAMTFYRCLGCTESGFRKLPVSTE